MHAHWLDPSIFHVICNLRNGSLAVAIYVAVVLLLTAIYNCMQIQLAIRLCTCMQMTLILCMQHCNNATSVHVVNTQQCNLLNYNAISIQDYEHS